MHKTATLELDTDTQRIDDSCGARPLMVESACRLLNAIVQDCSGQVVAFDLDSTLLDNRPRNALILREYGESVGNELLAAAQPHHWLGWSRSDAMRAAGLDNAAVEQHRHPFEKFWQQRFFTSEYCVVDDAVRGAAEFTARVADAGAAIAYITGRPERMRSGTTTSLQKHGLPVPGEQSRRPEVKLIMRPLTEDSDDDFKQLIAFKQLKSMGRVAAAFDNEPSHINAYRAEFPETIAVHLFTDHSMRQVPLLDGIVSIRYFPVDTTGNIVT